MSMPWTRARDLMAAATRSEAGRVVAAAVAVRMAGVDGDGWKTWIAQMESE